VGDNSSRNSAALGVTVVPVLGSGACWNFVLRDASSGIGGMG